MMRTYKYRLFPRRAEKKALDFILEQGRLLYNSALEQRINAYEADKTVLTSFSQDKHFRAMRKVHPETFGKLGSHPMQQVLRRLDKAFRDFSRRAKNGEKPGFPRFKPKNRFHSLDFTHRFGTIFFEDESCIHIQNVGKVKVKLHRALPTNAKIKHVVVKKTLGKWYAFLCCEIPAPPIQLNFNPTIGIDVGLKNLLTLSDGTTFDNPRWFRAEQKRLRKSQRSLARKKKGSNRRRKAAFQVAKIHDRIKNQRLDFWHKVTRTLTDKYGLIAIENLSLDFMIKNKRLALSTSDAALGTFRQLLEYKAENAGTRVVAVNPKNTTQACSRCNEIVPKTLNVRIHDCPCCGLKIDRDVNAARNILNLATVRAEPSWANVS